MSTTIFPEVEHQVNRTYLLRYIGIFATIAIVSAIALAIVTPSRYSLDVDSWCGGVGHSQYAGGSWRCTDGEVVDLAALCSKKYGPSAHLINIDPSDPKGWGFRCEV